jgi:hypothetical protein
LGGRGRRISEFKDSQGYTEKPCLGKKKKDERALAKHLIKILYMKNSKTTDVTKLH